MQEKYVIGSVRFGDIPFYGFESFTLVPIQKKMIKLELLEKHEVDWIDRYHSRVWNELNSRIDDVSVKEWYVVFYVQFDY
jgi:Xaa-Pro aminopeptidase